MLLARNKHVPVLPLSQTCLRKITLLNPSPCPTVISHPGEEPQDLLSALEPAAGRGGGGGGSGRQRTDVDHGGRPAHATVQHSAQEDVATPYDDDGNSKSCRDGDDGARHSRVLQPPQQQQHSSRQKAAGCTGPGLLGVVQEVEAYSQDYALWLRAILKAGDSAAAEAGATFALCLVLCFVLCLVLCCAVVRWLVFAIYVILNMHAHTGRLTPRTATCAGAAAVAAARVTVGSSDSSGSSSSDTDSGEDGHVSSPDAGGNSRSRKSRRSEHEHG